MKRRTYIIIAVCFVLLLLGVFLFVYFKFNKQNSTTDLNPNNQVTDVGSNKYLLDGGAGQIARDSVGNVVNTSGGPAPVVIEGTILPPKLRHIYVSPQAGAGFAYISFAYSTTSSTGKVSTSTKIIPLIRFVDRSLGHIYETATSTIINTRISNIAAPKTYVASFALDGKSVLLQNLANDTDVIASYFANISKKPTDVVQIKYSSSTASGTQVVSTSNQAINPPSPQNYISETDGYQLSGEFLANGLKTYEVSPDQTKLFYLDTNNGDSSGIITNLLTGAKSIVWKDPLIQWNMGWAGDKNLLFWNAPSGENQGALYLFNLDTKQSRLLVNPIAGLTALSSPLFNTNKSILIGDTVEGVMNLGVINSTNSAEKVLPLKTLPEKCVWSKINPETVYCAVPRSPSTSVTLPDAWYQGSISFNDDLWSINTKTGSSFVIQQLNDVATKAGNIDAINLSLNKTEDYLLFTNKKDLSLWGLRLIDPVIKKASFATSTASSTTR